MDQKLFDKDNSQYISEYLFLYQHWRIEVCCWSLIDLPAIQPLGFFDYSAVIRSGDQYTQYFKLFYAENDTEALTFNNTVTFYIFVKDIQVYAMTS